MANAKVYTKAKEPEGIRTHNMLLGYSVVSERIFVEPDYDGLPRTQTPSNKHLYDAADVTANTNLWEMKHACEFVPEGTPQVIIDGEYIGAFDEAEEWCKQNM
jgi:hypothetical protein